jgi:hypothetical protein
VSFLCTITALTREFMASASSELLQHLGTGLGLPQ